MPAAENETINQIDKDVPRTFPENHYLHGDNKRHSAAERLKEVWNCNEKLHLFLRIALTTSSQVLYTYVHYDKEVQYCQGMNLVAAFLMISCPFQNEEVSKEIRFAVSLLCCIV